MIKQGFSPSKVPDNLDAVVIGSGLGGLGTAAILSKAGKKVLVLEQHDQVIQHIRGADCSCYWANMFPSTTAGYMRANFKKPATSVQVV